jgi:archaemetzincin
MSHLALVPIYFDDSGPLVDPLVRRLERTLGLEVRIQRPWFDPEECFDPSRGQYRSTILLERLLTAPPDGAERRLGITSVDLFIPVLTFVFGEAQLDGTAAVVSTHRLAPEMYGLPPDPGLLAARIEKEAIHEVGHTLGLVHCTDGACVMHASTYVEEIDLKDAQFCASCRPAVIRPASRAIPAR